MRLQNLSYWIDSILQLSEPVCHCWKIKWKLFFKVVWNFWNMEMIWKSSFNFHCNYWALLHLKTILFSNSSLPTPSSHPHSWQCWCSPTCWPPPGPSCSWSQPGRRTPGGKTGILTPWIFVQTSLAGKIKLSRRQNKELKHYRPNNSNQPQDHPKEYAKHQE